MPSRPHPLYEEQLAVDNWEREYCFLRMWLLVGFLCSRGWPHIRVHMGSADLTLWTIKGKRRFEIEKEMCWRDTKELGEGSEECISVYNHISLYICMKFPRIKKNYKNRTPSSPRKQCSSANKDSRQLKYRMALSYLLQHNKHSKSLLLRTVIIFFSSVNCWGSAEQYCWSWCLS